MPTNDYRLRATVTYTVEYDPGLDYSHSRDEARSWEERLRAGCDSIEDYSTMTKSARVEVVR